MKVKSVLGTCASLAAMSVTAAGHAQNVTSSQAPVRGERQGAGTPPPTTPAEDGQLADIIVTAQKVEVNVQRVPIAVQTVSGDALLTAGIQNAQDLQRFVPGLYVSATGAGGSSFYIRGVGTINEAPSTDSGLAVSLDQAFFSRGYGPDLALYDLDRVEVLKGPQGTLYGRNATAGTINIISRKPRLGVVAGDFAAEVGNYSAVKVNGAYNVPLGDTVAARFAFQINKHTGYLRDGYDDANTKAARLHLFWQPTDAVSLLLSGEYLKNDARGPGITPYQNHAFVTADPYDGGGSPAARAFVLSRNPGPNVGLPGNVVFPARSVCLPGCLPANFAPTVPGPYQVDQNGFVDVTVKSFRADAEWDIGFATLSIIPALLYTDFTDKYFKGPTPIYNESDVNQKSLEVRLSSPTDRSLSWIAGLFYFNEKQSYVTFNGSAGPTSVTYSLTPDFRATSRAGFAQINWNVADTLKLTGGIRRTDDRKANYNATGGSINFAGGPPASESTVAVARDRSSATTYRVGADWQVTSANLLYGYVATGFHAGGFNPGEAVSRPLCSPPAAGATLADFANCDAPTEYDPEHLTAYALGSKNRFFGNRLQVNIEAYYWQYRDLQFVHLGVINKSVSGLRTDNAGNATIKGIDAEVSWLVTLNDLLTVNANYNQSEYGDLLYYNVTFGRSVTTINLAGRQFYNNPKLVTSFAFQHTFRLPGGGAIVPSINGKYQSKMIFGYLPAGQTTDVYQGRYAKFDLNLAYRAPDEGYSVSAFIRNVTDKAVILSATGGNSPGTASPWASLAPPRTYGVNFRTRF